MEYMTLFIIIHFFTTAFLCALSNAARDEGSGCTIGSTFGWVTDGCNGGFAIRCNRTGLKDIPTSFPRYSNFSRPCALDLRYNSITQIKNHSFVTVTEINFLFLFDNKISRIDSDAFVNLTNLHTLNLARNRLRNPTSFGDGVFEPFANMHMTFVSLRHNFLEAGEDLINLVRPLKRMEFFDMSYNELLTFAGMRYVLEGLANASVNVIILNHIHTFYEMGTKLKLEDIEPLINITNVTKLYLDLNKIEVVDEEVFDLLGNYNTLKRIGLGGNRLTGGNYTKSMYKMVHVKHVYLSSQHSNIDPFYRQYYEDPSASAYSTTPLSWGNGQSILQSSIADCTNCREHCSADICLCIPPYLEKVEWSRSYIEMNVGNVKVCEPSNLKYLDVSSNLIKNWTGPVKGLEHIETLDLADNYCQALEPSFFDTFYGLRFLDLSHNFLGPVFSDESNNDVNYFRNLTKLASLDLHENRLTLLPRNLFESLNNLKHLNLSNNMLNEWKSDLNANCLRVLDLRRNKFEYLPESLRLFLDKTANQPTTDPCMSLEYVEVFLSSNPLRCNCDNRPFLSWLGTSSVEFDFDNNINCRLENGNSIRLADRNVVMDIVKQLDTDCFPYLSIILSICTFVLGIVLCVFIYRNRWKLRYLYYKRRRRHNNVGDDRIFERDAFISYASSEGRFIKHFLIPAVEETRNFKVWVADRDSLPGVSVAENLAHAIGSSRKSILILSRRYFKEGWCDYEMNLARLEGIETHRKVMIIVMFEDLAAREIPLDYQRLLKTEEFLQYPTESKYNKTFWESLSSAILR